MKRLGKNRHVHLIAAATALLALFAACENPLQVGLGENVDIDRPDGEIRSPDSGQYLRGVVTLTGEYSDDSPEPPSVQVSYDDGATFASAEVDADGWSLEFDTLGIPDGELELLILITDASGKTTEKRQLYYVDNTAPLVLIKNPQGYASGSFNGSVTVRGEVADLFAIDRVAVQIQDDAGAALTGFETADGTNSWVYEFDSRIYADPAGDLRLAVQATDKAGNVSTTVLHYDDVLAANGNFAVSVEDLLRIRSGQPVSGVAIAEEEVTNAPDDTPAGVVLESVPVSIDNDLDKPTVTIVAPTNGQSVGGSVLVTGTAFDDDALDLVEMRIDLNGDGDYDDEFDLNGNGNTLDDFEDEDAWVALSGTVVWAQELNGDGELYQVEPGHSGQITIQVRAQDTKGGAEPAVVGNISQISIVLDDSLPRVEGLLVDGVPYANGLSVSGSNVVLSTRDTQTTPPDYDGGIRDDTQVDLIRISYNGGVSYRDIYRRSNSFNDGSVTETAPNDFRFEKSIDTTNIPDVGPITSGTLYMRLLVFDNNDPVPYQTFTYLTLNVDNVYPTGAWDPGVDSMEIEGTNALVQGIAEDVGAVSGVSEIQVYFVRAGQVYNLSANNSTVPVVPTDFGDGSGTVDYTPINGPDNNPPYYRISIDNTLEFGDDSTGGGDGDSFNEDLSLSGTTYNWSAEFDSTRIPDGEIELHYVVFDNAGNGTHYQRPAFIKNNRPSVTTLTVGTDLDFSATVEPDEQFGYSSPFPVRNQLYVDIDASDPGGGIATYEVRRDSDDSLVLPASGSFETGGTIDLTGEPEASILDLYALVTDTDGITARTDFSVVIDNDDEADSTVSLDSLTTGSVIDGHVESSSDSSYNNVTGAGFDADVSGTVALTGSAVDDQRIQFLYLTIEDHDVGVGPGARTQVAHWDAGSGGLVSDIAEFTIVSQTLTTSEHQVDYRYEWNTALGVAASAHDISIAVESEDFGSATVNDVASTQVDVVPYIAGVSTDTTGIRDRNARAASGNYVIGRSDAGADVITITGYNLNPIANGVRVSADPDGLVRTALQGDSLTVEDVAGDYTSVNVRKNATGSGYLAVVTGTGASPIPAINNINDNGLVQNQEPSVIQGNPSLTDDRYLTFFQTVDTGFVNGYYPEMIMDGDYPVFGFIDDSAASDLQFSRGEVTGETGSTATTSTIGLIRGLGFQYYALARDDDGIYHQLASSKFNSESHYYIYGEYASDYTGDCGFGTDNCGATRVYWAGFNRNRADGNSNDALLFDSLSYDPGLLVGRYKNPRLIANGSSTTAGTAASVFMAFFDSNLGEIVFRNFQTGEAPAGGNARDFRDTSGTNMDELPTQTTGDGTRHTVSANASQYFDMGLTDDGVIVIVYYNEATGRLNLVYSATTSGGSVPQPLDGANPSTAVNFSAPTVLPDLFVGSYVSVAIESDGSGATSDPIHVAAHDSSGADLAYIRFDDYTDTNPDVVTVDANLSVGIWTDIAVSPAGVPYIGYYNNSETGTRDSVKLAYFLGDAASAVTPGVDGSGQVTGNWEYMTVPAADTPNGGIAQFMRVSIGFDTGGNPVVGYLADDLEYARLLPPLP